MMVDHNNIGNHSMDRSIQRLLLAGGLIVSLAMGIRHGFGFFMPPMTAAFGWTRESFAFALGMQNLIWGLAQPFAGALADRHGPGKVLLGAACSMHWACC
jgi:MFS family permease